MFRLSKDNWDDIEFVLKQIKKNPRNIFNASPRLKKNSWVLSETFKGDENLIKTNPELLEPHLNNINFYMEIQHWLRNNPRLVVKLLSLASDQIRNNEELMVDNVIYTNISFTDLQKILGPKLKHNRDFWEKVVVRTMDRWEDNPYFSDLEMTKYYLKKLILENRERWSQILPVRVDPKFKRNQEVVLGYSQNDLEGALKWMDPSLKKDQNFMYVLWEANNFNSGVLEAVDPSIKDDLLATYKANEGRSYSSLLEDSENYEDEDNDEDNDDNEDNDNYEDEDEDNNGNGEMVYTHRYDRRITPTTKKTDFSYIFKNNITKLALSQYKGKKSSVISLFKLYSYVVDIRSNDIEEANLFRGKTLPLWKAILKEQIKQFTPNPKVTDTITQSLQVIDAYFKKNKQPLDSPSLQQEKVTLYKASRYKTLIVNLIQYMISFFGHMMIKVKPLQIVSDVSNIKVIGLMADAGGESPAVSQLLGQVTAIKDKLTQNLAEELGYSSINNLNKETWKGVEFYKGNFKGIGRNYLISLDTFKTYSSTEELVADVKKEKIIDKNYSQFQLSKGKVILPSKNKVVKTITYLTPEELKADIQEFQILINKHNSTLESYEKKLSNDPKTIQLGDHQVNVVKVLYKNISRLVVIDGPYQGHYVDELVSSTGEVIGSVSKASPALTETSKTLKRIDKTYSPFNEPMEFSNLQKISDYVSPTRLNLVLDDDYLEGVENYVSLDKNLYHNIVGNSILFNLGNEKSKLSSELKVEGNIITNSIETATADPSDATNIEIVRQLHFNYGNQPDFVYNSLFTASTCFPDGLGTRIFTQQAKSASEAGFGYIKTLAARGGRFMGYYIWPKLGYNTEDNAYIYKDEAYEKPQNKVRYDYLEKWLQKNVPQYQTKQSIIDAPISAIYACKAKDRFIGQELWKQFGKGQYMIFDLTPGSLSMRILEAYVSLKAKKEGLDPKDYLNVDYSRYTNYDLACLLKKYSTSYNKFKSIDLERRLEDSVKNYENGELFRIYQDPVNRAYLLNYLNTIKSNKPKLIEDIKLILSQKGYDNVKLASGDQMSEDPMIREIDESIINQVWDGINKLYESGTFK